MCYVAYINIFPKKFHKDSLLSQQGQGKGRDDGLMQEVKADSLEQYCYLLGSQAHPKHTALVHTRQRELFKVLTAVGLSKTFTKLQHLA